MVLAMKSISNISYGMFLVKCVRLTAEMSGTYENVRKIIVANTATASKDIFSKVNSISIFWVRKNIF